MGALGEAFSLPCFHVQEKDLTFVGRQRIVRNDGGGMFGKNLIRPNRFRFRPAGDTLTVCARHVTFQPSNEQFRLFERNLVTSIVHSAFGSITVTSATAPGISVPRSIDSTFAGFTVTFAISCGQVRWPGTIKCVTHN